MFEPWWPCFQDGELCAVKIGQLLGTQLSRYFWSPLCRQGGYLGMGLRLMKHTEHVHIPEETLQCARKLRKSSQHIPTLCFKLWDWIKTWIHTCTIVERMNIHMPAILMILMILGFWCSHMIPSWFGTWIILNLGPARGTCDPPMLSKMMAISIPTSLGRTGPLGPRELDTQRLRSWAVEVVYTSGQGVRNLCLFLVLKDKCLLPADEEPSRMKTRMPRDTSLSPFLEQCLMIGREQSFSSFSDQ